MPDEPEATADQAANGLIAANVDVESGSSNITNDDQDLPWSGRTKASSAQARDQQAAADGLIGLNANVQIGHDNIEN